MQLQTAIKGSINICAYFTMMMRLAGTFAIAGKPVEHADLVTYILTGLQSQEYKSLVTSLLDRGESMSVDDLYALLLSHEMRIEQKKGKISYDIVHNLTTNFAQKNQVMPKGVSGNQKGNFFNSNTLNSGSNSNEGGNFDSVIS